MTRVRRQRPQTNEPLRAHVTRVGFDLTLGRSHIAALVYLNESLNHGGDYHYRFADIAPDKRRLFNLWAPGIGGCITRGLVLHHYDERHRDEGLGWHYTLTRAGSLVVDLLRECGLYDEYAGALPAARREPEAVA